MFFPVLNVVFADQCRQEQRLLLQLVSLAYLFTSHLLSKLFHHCTLQIIIIFQDKTKKLIESFTFLSMFVHILQQQIIKMDYGSTYIEKELIGRGHYGRVYLIIHQKTQQKFVSKKIQLQGMTKQEQNKALKQVQIHQKLKHKNILQFKEYYLENQLLIMIMEYCQFGDLSVYIKQRKQKGEPFEEALIINLFVQMLFGLNYLHQHKILHRDIKTQNIFIDSQGTIKLADFGISKMLQHTQVLATTVVGTPYYLSPQACSSKGYNFKSDIWSLGCVLYELCTLQYPFNGDNILLLAKKISTEQPKDIPSRYSSQISKLIKSMLKKAPQQRPSIRKVLQTKFVSDYLIRFKMQDSLEQDIQEEIESQSDRYPIFETASNLQNEFLDLQYENGKVYKSQSSHQQMSKIQSSPKNLSNTPKGNKMDQIKISPQKSRGQNLRQKCIQKMGQQLFSQIYQFMRSAQRKNMNQVQVQQELKKRYSKKEFQMSMDVAQLLYLEEMERY